MGEVVFLIQTADRKGLLAGITGFFFSRGFNILQCSQYSDVRTERYFMRIALELRPEVTTCQMEEEFAEFASGIGLEYSMFRQDTKSNVALMVSKTSHCLYDLLMRADEGDLNCRIPLVVSNHPDLEPVAERFRIPYFCCPLEQGKKKEQEAKVIALLERFRIDLVVMARYMQILSNEFIAHFPLRIINIHHAFLPAFQGGNPYERAWERGVKMIGATAHYATAELDEGPIIEQDVERISHMDQPEDLKRIGKDIERRVLTRAVRAHLEHRVIVSGRRTIVFS